MKIEYETIFPQYIQKQQQKIAPLRLKVVSLQTAWYRPHTSASVDV